MENIVNQLIRMEQQLRILHWQTKSYARHNAFGETYSDLGDLIDSFMESWMGLYGRFELTDKTIPLENLDEMSVSEFVDESINFLVSLTGQLDSEKDTDLLNIRDEMLQKMKKLRYLLTLK